MESITIILLILSIETLLILGYHLLLPMLMIRLIRIVCYNIKRKIAGMMILRNLALVRDFLLLVALFILGYLGLGRGCSGCCSICISLVLRLLLLCNILLIIRNCLLHKIPVPM